jgi:hypothetical protein
MREKVIKLKLINKNKRYIGLKMSSVETRTAHSRDRWRSLKKRQEKNHQYEN